MALTVVLPPAAEPVELEGDGGVKGHLRVDGSDEDLLIIGLVLAAREWAEGFQNRAYITQTLELTLDAWPACGVIELPRAPLQRVEGITYRDKDGVEHTWGSANYVVDQKSAPGRIAPAAGNTWPADALYPLGAITVRYVAGYGDAAQVPQRVKQAMLLLVGHWFANREAVQVARQGGQALPIPFGVEALLRPGRVRQTR